MRLSFIALFMLTLLSLSFAEDMVAINSMDGRDVLSGIFYANALGIPVKFMPVPGGNADVFAAKIGSNHDVLLIQGSLPVSSFVESALTNKNNTITLYSSTDAGSTNLDLARKSGASSFIIVDSAYSDSAISVMPYAAKTKAYVLLANKDNIAEIKGIVSGKKVIIYGLVDQQVKDELSSLNPEIIGKGEDKYEDNILIVKKMAQEYSTNRALVVDGTFVEDAMTAGDQPIILSGRLVPQVTYDYLKQSVRDNKLSGVMLIGNDLVVPIYDMRERMKNEFEAEGLNKTFGITVKFAQVIPSAGTGVLTLDTFRMPSYKPDLEITETAYNTDSKKVMVSVDNQGEGAAYYTMEVRVKVNGQDFKTFGGDETKLIERGEKQGSEFALDLSSVPEGAVNATVLVKYGSFKKSLEEFTSYEGQLTTISYTDTSNVTVQQARYDSAKKSVLVTIKNSGAQTAYVFSKLMVRYGGSPTNISSSAVKELAPGSMIIEEFPLELTQEDLSSNKNASVFVDYGGRQGFLLKKAEFIVSLESAGEFPLILVGAALVVLVILAVAAYYFTKKPEKKK
jgi:hypothetical protein